jgi:hypothetical protein
LLNINGTLAGTGENKNDFVFGGNKKTNNRME